MGVAARTNALAGRRIAVTGAAGGIGGAIAELLTARGATVYGLDLNGVDQLPAGVIGREIDLRSPESIRAIVSELYELSAEPIHLVNSAGIVEDNVAAEEISTELYDAVMGVNLRGVFLTCQAFGRELLARGGGSIVNIASMSGNHMVNAPQHQSIYNTSKAGVTALTKSLAVEWSPHNVRVNVLSPGYVDTKLNYLKRDMHEAWLADTVLGRFATPEEVAESVAFLLDETVSGYYVGAELLMDGGSSLR